MNSKLKEGQSIAENMNDFKGQKFSPKRISHVGYG